MITDTEIKTKGFQLLAKHLGDVEAERFIALIQREPFDYTKWRQDMDEDLSLEEISQEAMAYRKKLPNNSANLTAYWLAVAALPLASTRQVTLDVRGIKRPCPITTNGRGKLNGKTRIFQLPL